MKVALVYDRVNKWGGAERVLLALHEIFPNAPLFTSVYSPTGAPWAKAFPKVIPSFLQKLPFARTNHEKLALLMPQAFESLDLKDYDVVISVSSEAAKGVLTNHNQKHINYCLTPTRYLWSGHDDYFNNSLKRTLAKHAISYLRRWDKIAATRPDEMIAISTGVQQRIGEFYNREANIIFPPLTLQPKVNFPKEEFFLVVSRLVPYKKVGLSIEAFNRLKQPLIIVGSGSEERKLRAMAKKNIKFLANVTDKQLTKLYTQAKALIFPQIEDFGLVAVESLAAGTAVIALREGGVKDIIEDGENGLFFDEQSVDSLVEAVARFHKMQFSATMISQSASKFSKERFQKEFLNLVYK